jgi:ubiquinone/menaquinone biosynthesis C-methylase UbiE
MIEKSYHLSQRVHNYIRYRPRYPQAVLDLLKAECQLTNSHIIADIGSGTGILAELFLQNGNFILGVEPDPDMRAGAEYCLEGVSNFTSIAATAEATTLPDRRMDFVTVGQAFHWFNLEQAKREFDRILAPQGWVVLVWNVQRAKGTPFLEALQNFWETKRFWKRSWQQSSEQMERAQAYRLSPELVRQELLEPFFGSGAFKQKVFENPLICDSAGLRGRVLSNGPALKPGEPLYPTMLAALEEIFWTHQENGTVTIEHDTHVVYGRLSSEM